MTTYAYVCPECGMRQEKILPISQHVSTQPCPCGAVAEQTFDACPAVLVKGNCYDFKLDVTDMPLGWDLGNTDCVAQERAYAKDIEETRKLAVANDKAAIKNGIRHIARVPRELLRTRRKQFGKDYMSATDNSPKELKQQLKADGLLFKD